MGGWFWMYVLGFEYLIMYLWPHITIKSIGGNCFLWDHSKRMSLQKWTTSSSSSSPGPWTPIYRSPCLVCSFKAIVRKSIYYGLKIHISGTTKCLTVCILIKSKWKEHRFWKILYVKSEAGGARAAKYLIGKKKSVESD